MALQKYLPTVGPCKSLVENESKVAVAGVRSDEIKYIETHGTGTSIGATIEANTLGKVVSKNRKTANECIILKNAVEIQTSA